MARWKTSGVVRIGARSKADSVSARSPSRRVSSPMTRCAGTFPRFTSGPSRVTKYACSAVLGASKSRLSWVRPDEHVLDQPEPQRAVGLQIPDFPLSLASRVTINAPAARSSSMYRSTSSAEPLGAARVLVSDLGHHGEVTRELADVARLLRVGHQDRPVGHLDVPAGPGHAEPPVILKPALHHLLLKQRPAKVESDLVCGQHVDLRRMPLVTSAVPQPNLTS